MNFEIEFHANNLSVNESLNDYVLKKINKLNRYIKNINEVRVDLSYIRSARNAQDRNVAQITVRGKGFILRAEERADDIIPAFDRAIAKLHRRIEHYKGKHFRGRGDGSSIREPQFAEKGVEQQSATGKKYNIVRRKKFSLRPMSEREAIEQMNLLGHEDFFVFFNVENDSVNVLYRRRDESYGIIETMAE